MKSREEEVRRYGTLTTREREADRTGMVGRLTRKEGASERNEDRTETAGAR